MSVPTAASSPASTTDLASGHPILRGVIVMVTLLMAAAVVNAHASSPIRATLLLAMVLALGALSWIDVAEHRLPNRITAPMAAVSVVAVMIGAIADGTPLSGLVAIAVGFCFAIVLAAFRFGMGDVKLAFSIGTVAGWLGTSSVLATIMFASVSGGLVAAALMIVHRRRSLRFGFGPFLALGAVAGMLAFPG